MNEISIEQLQNNSYDVVIVGAGVSGAIVAKELANNGLKILIMEAGLAADLTVDGYQKSLNRYFKQIIKSNNSPYQNNPNADSPHLSKINKYQSPGTNDNGYFANNGPFTTDTNYMRSVGGSTMHWMACTPRMLPDDFATQSLFGQGRDWPITYEQLEPYYRKAEFELGVSGDVEEQDFHNIKFAPGYVYPHEKMPASYLDQVVSKGLDGMKVNFEDEQFTLKMRSTPQARNGVPNPKYDGGKGYVPHIVSGRHQVNFGQRCQGNANCIPICPVQAKYDARRTLLTIAKEDHVDFIAQTVASKVAIDTATGNVTAIHYKHYKDPDIPEYTEGTVTGKIFVLATNAVENPKLMLASGLNSTSNLMGKNFMDHVYFLTWALLPEAAGTMRGPQSTSGIDDLRSGKFRKNRAAYRVEIQNMGWGWATGSPFTDLIDLVENKNLFGPALRKGIRDRISNQLLVSFMVDQLPDENNSISIDPNFKDVMGNYRPVLNYGISEYSMAGVASARELSKEIFQRLGAQDCTEYHETDFGYFTYKGQGYSIVGGNHFSGTHIMGSSKLNSVVNYQQRCWDHQNLYMIGSGSSVSINTSNPTLTLSALAFMAAESIMDDLKKLK